MKPKFTDKATTFGDIALMFCAYIVGVGVAASWDGLLMPMLAGLTIWIIAGAFEMGRMYGGEKEGAEVMKEERTTEEFLDWLCWTRATTGERFYPPDETAEECMEAHQEQYEDRPESERVEAAERELAQHSRAWLEAVELFDDMHTWGFDPVERAERHVEKCRERGDDIPEIDWSWLEDSHYSGMA